MDDKDLQLNFADFCFDHFQHNDTTKEDQYKTPQGSKDSSPNGNESESIEVVETPSNTYGGPLQESTISSASTNNTDICVLDSYFANDNLQLLSNQDDDEQIDGSAHDEFESEEGDEVFLKTVDVVDKNEDFTVLHKPTPTRRLCNCEESTEVLMLINSDYQDRPKIAYSGTDSDVEVLMSEDVIESDWSSGNGLEEDIPNVLPLTEKSSNHFKTDLPHTEEELTSTCGLLQQSCECNSLKTQASTVFNVSGEEMLNASFTNDKYQHLNRMQLLQIIKKQELCIQALEATVERYQNAQQRLFEHVDALRLELSEISISPLNSSEQSKNV